MLESEFSGYAPRVEVVNNTEQSGPFAVKKDSSRWQLSVNRSYFESKGFLSDEINGAIYLEEERVTRQTSVTSQVTVEGLQRWQMLARDDPKAVPFKSLFERLSALSSLEERDSERGRLARRYLERFASRSPGVGLTDQLFSSVLQISLGQDPTPQSPLVTTVLTNLGRQETIEEGRSVSPLEALVSPDITSNARSIWFETRFLPRLRFLEQQEQNKQPPEPTSTEDPQDQPPENQPYDSPPPPPNSTQDEYEQHRGREEKGPGGKPIFVIDPSYTGYWEEDSFDSINEQTGRLIKSSTQRMKTAVGSLNSVAPDTKRTMSGQTGTELFSLPLAPNFTPTQEALNTLRSQKMEVFTDSEGHMYIKSPTSQPVHIEIGAVLTPSNSGIKSKDTTVFEQNLPYEIAAELTRIHSLPMDSLGKVQQWVDFIQGNFKYPTDEQVEGMYAAVDNSSSRITTMMANKLLDCYLAREFFLAGLKRLNLEDIEWRGVNGHYIANAQKNGTAHIHSGTGHAWVKLRPGGQRNWLIIDPTPPGDPIHQGEGAMDEFGKMTDQQISDQDMQELADEVKEAEGKKEKKPMNTVDQYLMQFAREAGVESDEARQILEILSRVDQMTDRQGRVILHRLQEQFDRIIEEYTYLRQEPLGNVEMSRGRDLDDPVAARIDVRAGNLDPYGFSRKRIVEEKEKYYGGLDLEIVADGSSSMGERLGGKIKCEVQRDMSYLLHRGLHRFSQDAQRRRLRLVTHLKIRSSQYMFRGNSVEEIKPLTDEFTPAQMALLWEKSAENIRGGTPAHLGLQAILDRIPPEEVQLLQDKKLLKVIALISDGNYDDPSKMAKVVKRLQEMNVIVAQFPIRDAQSLDNLPQNVAESVIEAAKQLMPERIKRG